MENYSQAFHMELPAYTQVTFRTAMDWGLLQTCFLPLETGMSPYLSCHFNWLLQEESI